ncbi:MAG: hypothetical protein WD249_05985 [Gaiellaceae bacterium]
MRKNILEQNPDAELAVHVVWVPQIGATRGDIDADLFGDDRVTVYWDPAGVVGQTAVGDANAYDVYVLYDGEADLGSEDVVASGRPVIADADHFKAEVERLLK